MFYTASDSWRRIHDRRENYKWQTAIPFSMSMSISVSMSLSFSLCVSARVCISVPLVFLLYLFARFLLLSFFSRSLYPSSFPYLPFSLYDVLAPDELALRRCVDA